MAKEFSYFKNSVVHRRDGSWVKNPDNIGLLIHAFNIRLKKMLIDLLLLILSHTSWDWMTAMYSSLYLIHLSLHLYEWFVWFSWLKKMQMLLLVILLWHKYKQRASPKLTSNISMALALLLILCSYYNWTRSLWRGILTSKDLTGFCLYQWLRSRFFQQT